MNEKDLKKNITKRPPVVVIMGHIDHGKSTLLDYIRNTSITQNEAGGITQHISAYEVETSDQRKITFLDTPGHEAFCSIRSRGASIADMAILVVSAEDGVKPQTIEAINCIKNDSLPFIVAINKIDKPNANVDKVKQNLAENEIFLEGWGGTIPFVPISAKTGQGIEDLIEIILLQSDIENFEGDRETEASGFVIESSINAKKGISATLIIKNGVLKSGMFVSSTGSYAPTRLIENWREEPIKEASFSSPIIINGWDKIPRVGSIFKSFYKKDDAIEYANLGEEKIEIKKTPINESRSSLEFIIKADAEGSLDAIEYELNKISNEKISAKIIYKNIGNINEKDVKLANIKKNIILGFNVSSDKNAESLALREKINIKIFNVIYDLINFVKAKIEEKTPVEKIEQITGTAKILRVFSKNKDKQVLGGRVEKGEIKVGNSVKILRREIIIGEGKIKELQTQKIKTNEVKEGQEFGMMIESKIEIVQGDFIDATQMIETK